MRDLPASVTLLAEALAPLPGVVGVVLGGSRARGQHGPDADTDLGLYYEAPAFDWPAVVAVLKAHDDRRAPLGLGAPGEWGPWMNGGAWLKVEGRAVDVLLRDVDFVGGIIDQARQGRFSQSYQIGHPHGWHSYMVLGEVHHNVPIVGDLERLRSLQQKTVPYPDALRRSAADRFLFEARFSAILLRKLESREEPTQAAGLAYRAVMCLVQVLFAANETYPVNEKGAVDATRAFAHAPRDFAARAHAVSAPSPLPRADRNAALWALVDEVEEIVRGYLKLETSWNATSFPA